MGSRVMGGFAAHGPFIDSFFRRLSFSARTRAAMRDRQSHRGKETVSKQTSFLSGCRSFSSPSRATGRGPGAAVRGVITPCCHMQQRRKI